MVPAPLVGKLEAVAEEAAVPVGGPESTVALAAEARAAGAVNRITSF